MGKSCRAIDCTNRFAKESELSFYRIPKATEKRRRWIATTRRHNWNPGTETWICSPISCQTSCPEDILRVLGGFSSEGLVLVTAGVIPLETIISCHRSLKM
ncbi:uncharacterized protein AKAME5_000813200 [Lates japonicus]|uniref:THAP-type domain-containing protein n=1 Tax=Lates japonicus TaxID=270547 RepID=A0AAD3MJ10_LATJO|nr:uncharacterized protein AKAME5_000813200 [Lates japonicus]